MDKNYQLYEYVGKTAPLAASKRKKRRKKQGRPAFLRTAPLRRGNQQASPPKDIRFFVDGRRFRGLSYMTCAV